MNALLGGRIKDLRNAGNLTQEQMADRIGVSRQKYANIESGVSNISLDILTKISGVLGVSVADITSVLDETPDVTYKTGEKNSSSEKISNMLDLFCANKHLYAKLQNDLDKS
jgi:transcriptional regulator with XRE-family HTH domain